MPEKIETKKIYFHNNPFDIEVLLDTFNITCKDNKEMFFFDFLLHALKTNPTADTTDMCYAILKELKLIELEMN